MLQSVNWGITAFTRLFGVVIVFLAFCLGTVGVAGTGKSVLVNRVSFTVAPAQYGATVPPPVGLPATAVEAERIGPWPGAGMPDSADDDVYLMDETFLPPGLNLKIVDDGFPTIPVHGTGVLMPPPGLIPPPQATLPNDSSNMNALAMESPILLPDVGPGGPEQQIHQIRDLFFNGMLFLQFSVDNAALGLPLTAVDWEATLTEVSGDVFEAVFPSAGANVLLADEDSLGLFDDPAALDDDVDGMIVQDVLVDPAAPAFFIDTLGDGTADTPFFFFSVDPPSLPIPGITSSDILVPGNGSTSPPTPATQPLVFTPHPVLGLQPGDDIDALFIDQSSTKVMFSLAAGSPSLLTIPNLFSPGGIGADPGDILFVDTVAPLPFVLLLANEIGLQGDMVAGGGPADDELNALWVTVASLFDQFSPLTINSHPSGATKCPGESVTFTVSASGTPPIHYQWQKDGNPIPGATQSSYTINPVAMGDAGTYVCIVTNQIDGSIPSNPAVLTVLTPVNITSHPQNATICPGDPVTFTVNATGSPTVSYQWRYNGSDILGAVNSSYGIGSVGLGDAGNYDCVVTNPCGSQTSATAVLTVNGPLDVTVDPHPVVAQGIAFVVWDAILDCAIPTIEIQWEDLDTPFTYTLNQDPITIDPKPSQTTHYRVTVTDELTREVVQRPATLLVAVDTIYFDYNSDNCNSLDDLYLLCDEWRESRPLNDDPNGDGIVDIRDYLYINLDDPGGCP